MANLKTSITSCRVRLISDENCSGISYRISYSQRQTNYVACDLTLACMFNKRKFLFCKDGCVWCNSTLDT